MTPPHQPSSSSSSSAAAASSGAPKSSPNPYPPRAHACDCFIFILFLTTSAILICLLPAVLRGVIFLQPRLPHITIHSSSFSSILNATTNSTTAAWKVTVSFQNPNAHHLSYDKLVVSAVNSAAGDQALSIAAIPSFSQPGKTQETKLIAVVFGGISVCGGGGFGGGSANCGGGNLELRMEMQGRAKYGGWTWPAKKDSIRIVCEGVKVEVGPTSNVTTATPDLGARKCDVDGWWNRIVRKCSSLFWNYIYLVGIFLFILLVSL